MFRGSPIEPVLLKDYKGMLVYEGSRTAERSLNEAERSETLASYAKLAGNTAGSIFAETYNTAVRQALEVRGRKNRQILVEWDLNFIF